jgi:putative oxidoreductase
MEATMPLLDRVLAVQDKVANAADRLRSPLLLAIRLYWGWSFFTAGRGKLENLERTTEFFRSLSIPAPQANALLAACTECFGGLLLLAGLGSRLVAVPLAFTMGVAYLTAHRESLGTLFSNPDEFTSQAPFLFLLASLVVLAFGPGAISLDALLERRAEAGSRNKHSQM